ASMHSTEPAPAAEPVWAAGKGRGVGKRAEKPASRTNEATEAEIAHEAVPERIEAAESEPETEAPVEPEPGETHEGEAVNEVVEELGEKPELVIKSEREPAAE